MKKQTFLIVVLVLILVLSAPLLFACKKEEELPVEEEPQFTYDSGLKIYYIGEYPQKKVDIDVATIKACEQDPVTKWYTYENKKYAVLKAAPNEQDGNNSTFSDGSEIVKDVEYVFEVQKLAWKSIYSLDGKKLLFANSVIDCTVFAKEDSVTIKYDADDWRIDEDNYWNSYEFSDLRSCILDIHSIAFTSKQKDIIVSEYLENKKSSEALSACSETQNNYSDPMFALSWKDFEVGWYKISKELGDGANDYVKKNVTDYAAAKGAMKIGEKGFGSYWLRSASYKSRYAYRVDVSKNRQQATLTSKNIGVCPAIRIKTN